MFITNINEDRILFDNGSYITFEDNIKAPFVVRADNYPALELLNDYSDIKTHNFLEPLQFNKCTLGFSFGDSNWQYFIPCYSVQTTKEDEDSVDNTIDILYKHEDKVITVLSEVSCTIN